LEEVAKTLPQSKLEEMKASLHKVYKKRFITDNRPKYGSINKGFTELELQHFLRNVKNDKFRLLFKYQAYLGLRVGEVSKLQVGNINFDKRELTLMNEKSKKTDTLLIPLELFKETIEFVSGYAKEIKSADGYLFFKDHTYNTRNTEQHIDVNYVRKVFRETIIASNLNENYGHSEETYPNHKERRLYRLTTHSLRHYAITHFAKATNGNVVLASRFARHSKPTMTMRYIGRDNEELFKNIDFAFSDKMNSIKSMFSK
jgi:integrase